MRTFLPSTDFGKAIAGLVGFGFVAALAIPLIYWNERSGLKAWASQTETFVPQGPQRHLVQFAGLDRPGTLPASGATLGDGELILGIEVGGKARAYHQRSMNARSRHVVNDVIGGRAITVTYCDLADCARAFGGDDRPRPARRLARRPRRRPDAAEGRRVVLRSGVRTARRTRPGLGRVAVPLSVIPAHPDDLGRMEVASSRHRRLFRPRLDRPEALRLRAMSG